VFEEYWLLGYLLYVAIAITLMIVGLALARAITRGSRRAWIAMIGIAALTIPVGVATSYVFKLGPDDYYWAESMGLVLSNGAFQLLLIVLLLRSRRDLPSAD
jgi:zinc transporter ZupT